MIDDDGAAITAVDHLTKMSRQCEAALRGLKHAYFWNDRLSASNLSTFIFKAGSWQHAVCIGGYRKTTYMRSLLP
jgi:hypothetical protein